MKTTYKNFFAAFAVVLVVLMLVPQAVFAVSFPKHENYIADEADILTEDVINEIKNINKNLTGDFRLTIAVCTVKTTGGEDIAAYARDLFSAWKLGEGVLVLIAKEDSNYYFVPSTGVEDILSNEEIASIRDEYFEADFANGTYERAVHKVVMKLKNVLVAGMEARAAAAEAEAEAAESENETSEEKGTPAGNAIVTFFKILLWLAIIAIFLFVGLFVWAMFNEDVAALMQKYIFRRKNSGRSKVPQNYYDDRLYGNRNPNPQRSGQAQRRPNPNGYYGNNSGYLGDGRSYPQGYPQNGYPQQQMQGQPNYNRGGYPVQGQYPYPTQNPNMQGQYPQQQMNPGYGYPQQNGYPQQRQYPQQQNPYGAQQNGYYAQGQQQGYPQQMQNNPYGGQQMQQNHNGRPGYGTQQSAGDATVQFNIPRRN